jgi:hypothetical protein
MAINRSEELKNLNTKQIINETLKDFNTKFRNVLPEKN